MRIQSTDTFQGHCKSPANGQKAGLRGRTSKISFSRQPAQDTFEGSRMPEPVAVRPKSSTKDKVKTLGVLGLGFGAIGISVLASKRV